MFIRKTVKRHNGRSYTFYLFGRVGQDASGRATEDDLLVGRPVAGAAADKKQRAIGLDGTYLLKTDRKDLTAEEAWRLYIL